MQREVTARLDLLQVARETLLGEVAPALAGAQRYTTLMIANALRIVERELALTGSRASEDVFDRSIAGLDRICTETDARTLCEVLRNGGFDGNPGLHRALYRSVVREVAVTRPDVLTSDERHQISLD